jgi:hypothetical protein
VDWFNDVWSYDPRTNQWTQLDCIGFIPSRREGHAAALVNDVMYIFGGRSSEGTDLGDLAAFRISSRRWYTFQNMGPSPSPRSGHTMSTVNTKIIVLGGEPSVPARSQEELQLVYVLDTAKIRYPNDNPSQISPTDRNRPGGPPRAAIQGAQSRSVPPEQMAPGNDPRGPTSKRLPRESVQASPPNTVNSPQTGSNNNGAPGGSRLPRASVPVQPSGPPPTQQAPPPRSNGSLHGSGSTSKPPTGPNNQSNEKENVSPSNQASDSLSAAVAHPAPVVSSGQKTPTQRKDSLSTVPERSSSQQQQQQQIIEGVNNPNQTEERSQTQFHSHGSLSQKPPSIGQRPTIDMRDPSDQPSIDKSTDNNAQPLRLSSTAMVDTSASLTGGTDAEALSQEVGKLKRINDWYASELALARRAGYTPQTNNSPLLDDRARENLPEDERPFLEAMLALKGQLVKVQSEVDSQSASAAKRIQEIERQRDVAVQEAVYAKAKLAALGGPVTPVPGDRGGSDTASMDTEKMTDMSRKLAASLSAQADLSAKVEVLTQEVSSEKMARQLSEETAAAAQARITELDEYRNWAASQIETLRAELLDAGKAYRDEAALGQEATAEVKLLRLDQAELTSRLEDVLAENRNYQSSIEHLGKAMQATNHKSGTLERQLEEERLTKEALERRLGQLRSEYEEKTADLQSMNQRLKDVEELMETYAQEAKAANAVMTAGLDKVIEREQSNLLASTVEERVRILQEQVENTQLLLSKSQAQADEAGQKLAEAMQRVAGLEFQQGQSSKDSIALRRRMAEVGDEARRLKQENAELLTRINERQLEVDATTAKYNALNQILQERTNQAALEKSRSHILQSPSPGSGTVTPEQFNRLRELETRLEESLRAHRETKNTAEMQAQEVEKHFREKLEQLENDYQSAVHYVKGTEKMLKRMKEELTKHKALTARLQIELEDAQRKASERGAARSDNEADWEHERELLNKEIEDLRDKVRESATALDKQLRETKSQLDALRDERDQLQIRHNQLQMQLLDSSQQASEARSLIEKLETENASLESRAQSAEQKVSMLLDQVENSVDNYRRSTRVEGQNGEPASARSSYYGSGQDNRTSVALESLASELDALRNRWDINESYRLSNAFDFEKSPASPPVEFTSNIAQWRQKLAQEEEAAARSSNNSRQGLASPTSPHDQAF